MDAKRFRTCAPLALLVVVWACATTEQGTNQGGGGDSGSLIDSGVAGSSGMGVAGMSGATAGHGGGVAGGAGASGHLDGGAGSAGTGTGGTGGIGGQAGYAGIAGAGGADLSETVPESCIHAGVTPEACNPINNVGCQDGQACDFITAEDFKVGFACAHGQETDGVEGDPCDNIAGPFCQVGLHCMRDGTKQVCAYMCCSDSDCRGAAKQCVAINAKKIGTFGFCE